MSILPEVLLRLPQQALGPIDSAVKEPKPADHTEQPKRVRFEYDPSVHQYTENDPPQMREIEPEHLVLMQPNTKEEHTGEKQAVHRTQLAI